MDKQTTAAFILIGIILVVWLYINSPEPQPPAQNIADTTSVEEQPTAVKELEKEIAEEINLEENVPDTSAFRSEEKEEKRRRWLLLRNLLKKKPRKRRRL